MKLYSPEDVQAMFPENHRPSLKRVIAKAKEAGCCCKLGRGIGFTPDQVQAFFAYISGTGTGQISKKTVSSARLPPKPGESYLKVRELLNAAKRGRSGK